MKYDMVADKTMQCNKYKGSTGPMDNGVQSYEQATCGQESTARDSSIRAPWTVDDQPRGPECASYRILDCKFISCKCKPFNNYIKIHKAVK